MDSEKQTTATGSSSHVSGRKHRSLEGMKVTSKGDKEKKDGKREADQADGKGSPEEKILKTTNVAEEAA